MTDQRREFIYLLKRWEGGHEVYLIEVTPGRPTEEAGVTQCAEAGRARGMAEDYLAVQLDLDHDAFTVRPAPFTWDDLVEEDG